MPPHRNQVSIQLKYLYSHHYQILKDELKEVDYIGLTIDFWSNRRCMSFLCITGHWYKEKMQYDSQIIHFSSFNERHTSSNIAHCIKQSLISLDIYHKIVAITCDGGQNLIAACRLLGGGIKRIWCCAHRLHLSVINSLGIWNKEEAPDASASNIPSTQSVVPNIIASNTTPNDEQEVMDVNWNSEQEPGKFFYAMNTDKHDRVYTFTNTFSRNHVHTSVSYYEKIKYI